MAELRQSDQVLASLDMDATIRFYLEKMGFQVTFQDSNYGIVRRDDIGIHFWKCDDPVFPQNTSCSVYVTGIDTIYLEMLTAGVVHPNGPLGDKVWGIREFAILDGDGNMIKFGEPIS